MIHNIVTDREGNEHQAVFDDRSDISCLRCSLFIDTHCEGKSIPESSCIPEAREDGVEAIYKRRIKIGDIKR